MQIVQPEEVDSAIIAGALRSIRKTMTETQYEQLRQHFAAKDCILPDDGLGHLSPIIMSYGKIGGAISRQLNLKPKNYQFRWLMTDRPDPGGNSFSWHLHRNVVTALELTGWFPQKTKTANEKTSSSKTLQGILRELELGVAASLLEQRSSRLERLRNAARLPEKVIVTTVAYLRNRDVIAEALYRSSGKCESCAKPAPFTRASDGSPYLEVHHSVPLAEGGEDTLENAVALCPNCHRRMHLGHPPRTEVGATAGPLKKR